MSLVAKLSPGRFPGMSGKMAAIVGYVLGVEFTTPAIAEMYLTADGFVLARLWGDIGANGLIGSRSDLERNWRSLLDCAGLSPEERARAEYQYACKIHT